MEKIGAMDRYCPTVLTVEAGDVFGWLAVVPSFRATSTAIAVEARAFLHRDGPRRLIALLRECGRSFLGIAGEWFKLGDGISPAVRQGVAGYQCAIARRLEAIGGATCG